MTAMGQKSPTLAAALLAEAVLAGTISPSARDAGRLLDLEQFEPLFASLSAQHRTVETRLPPPLYEHIMGPRYASLPEAVRAMHRICADGGPSGEAVVERGEGLAARFIAWVMRFSPAGRHSLHVAFTERQGAETWTRAFGSHGFTSRLSARNGRLVERFGPLQFSFDLYSDDKGLAMEMRGWSCLGIPLPMALAPRSRAREWQEDKRFRFDVSIALPLVGPIVHYTGWLTPDT